MHYLILLLLAVTLFGSPYNWLPTYSGTHTIETEIQPPAGAKRVQFPKKHVATWLQGLPLKQNHPKVFLYNGELKNNQSAHYRVIDIDVGKRDLQQCADAMMRLRAEYLYSQKRYKEISFNFTSGHPARYIQWRKGYRPVIRGNNVNWKLKRKPNKSYHSFRQYMDIVFSYAGTHSLSKELPAQMIDKIQPGDMLLKGGFPGHGVLVVDLAKDPKTEKIYYLLAQSYMPAQEIHILKNPINLKISPWYELKSGKHSIITPEWPFDSTQFKRFK